MLMGENHNFLEAQVKEAWKQFVINGKVNEWIKPMVAQSWIKSVKIGLDPKRINKAPAVEKADIERRIKKNKDLLAVILPIMAELQSLVEGSGFLTLITDSDGVILEVLSDEGLQDVGLERNLIVGGVWKEEKAGTNAIALAISLERPVQIVGAEHYFECDHDITCSATPIFNYDGRLLGVLNMSGLKERVHPHTLGMVVAASKAITNQLRIEEDSRQIWLSNQYLKTVIESISDGVVAIDSTGRIREINSEGAKILAIDVLQARGKNIQELLDGQPFLKRVVDGGKLITDMETVMNTNRGQIHFHTSARPIILADGQIAGAVATLKEIKRLHRVVNQITGAEARFTFEDIIGQSSIIQRTIHLAQVAARNFSTVLIQGESGTGKELFAQAIHNANLVGQPFIAVNCAAIPETLIESELFGYEGGAFTGASRNGRPGKFELASGGTIFLDEIGEMPLNVQAVLLRVLQERCVERVGGIRSIPVNVRVIAATNKNLANEVQKSYFRQDLYYRLNVFKIDIPPLRERLSDIPLFIEYFVSRIADRFGKSISGVSLPVLKKLQSYSWLGNVRQLENVIERAVNLADGDLIEEYCLPDFLQEQEVVRRASGGPMSVGESANMEYIEKRAIIDALQHFGERQKVAKSLGISRSTLYRRLKKYELEDEF